MIRKLTATTLIGTLIGALALGVFERLQAPVAADRANAGGVHAALRERPRRFPVIRRKRRLEDSEFTSGWGEIEMSERASGWSILLRRKAFVAVIGGMLAAPTMAAEFALGDDNDIKGAFNATITAGAAWRMTGRDSALYAPANGNQQGLPTGRGSNSDDGDLNYGNGQLYDSFVTAARRSVAQEEHLRRARPVQGVVRLHA